MAGTWHCMLHAKYNSQGLFHMRTPKDKTLQYSWWQ